MKTYSINIAQAYTQSDWRGLPAHKHHALVILDDGMSESEAVAELCRLQTAYPWPEFHLTLTAVEIIRLAEKLYSSAPMDFLKAHQWDKLASTHEGDSNDDDDA